MMNPEQPLVSIILPTYNGSRYLAEAIESCLAQTYGNWELILVDDCSKDVTPQVIADYVRQDPRIRSIRHETNKKLPGALNTGHAAATGSYLMWTSDDNRLRPDAIEKMGTFLDEHPAIGLVYAYSVVIDEEGRYLQDNPAQPASKLAYFNAVGACCMYRRYVYETVGEYDADVLLAEDYDYWLRIYRQFDIAPLHKVLYEYRSHGESLTNTTTPAAVRASVERTLWRHLPHLHRSSPQDRARGWLVCAGAAVRRWAPIPAARACAKALRTAPGFSVGAIAKKLVGRL